MAPAGNHLLNHQQASGLQQLQSTEYIVAPPFVMSIAASTRGLKAAGATSELSQ